MTHPQLSPGANARGAERQTMSEAAHTPGPWAIEYATTRVKWPVIVAQDDDYEEGVHQIAEVTDHVAERVGDGLSNKWKAHPEAAEAMANAHLIAAAPDLLSAAKLVLAGLELRIDKAPRNAVPVFNGIAELHAAIGKAEGRQS